MLLVFCWEKLSFRGFYKNLFDLSFSRMQPFLFYNPLVYGMWLLSITNSAVNSCHCIYSLCQVKALVLVQDPMFSLVANVVMALRNSNALYAYFF